MSTLQNLLRFFCFEHAITSRHTREEMRYRMHRMLRSGLDREQSLQASGSPIMIFLYVCVEESNDATA